MEQTELLEEISLESSKSVFGGLFGKVLDYLLVVTLARFLQPSGYGLYATGFMIASVIVALSQLGLRDGMTRFVSRAISESREDDIANIYVFTTGVALAVSVVLVLAGILASSLITDAFLSEAGPGLLFLFLLSVPFRILLTVSLGLFNGFNDMGTRVGIELSRDSLQVAVAFGLIFLGATLQTMVLGLIGVLVLIGVVTFGLSVRKLVEVGPQVDIERMRELGQQLFVYSLPLWYVSIANLGMNWADIIVLSYYLESEVVGIYQSAFSLSSGLWVLLISFSTPFFPMASRLYTASKYDQLEDLFQLVTRWINLIMLPVFVFSFVFAEPVVNLMFGNAYAAGATILRVLLIGGFVHVASGNNVIILKSSDNTRVYFLISVLTMVLNLLLNVVLIPVFEGVGAAVATSGGYLLLNVSVLAYVYRRFGIWGYSPLSAYGSYVISGFIALIPVSVLHLMTDVHIVLLSLLYASIYFGLVALQDGFTNVDKEILRMGVRRIQYFTQR